MSKHDDSRAETRRPKGIAFLRFIYGAALIAFGACLGIVIGSLSETPRLLLERMRGPVQTIELETRSEASPEAAPLERFGELQEGKSPRKAHASPAQPKAEAEVEPPPPLVPTAELAPAPPVAAAPPEPAKPPQIPETAGSPASAQPHTAVVQVASYVERKPADDLVAKLAGDGFDAYVSQPAAQNGRYRVRVRPGTGESAGDLAGRLRSAGFDTWATTE